MQRKFKSRTRHRTRLGIRTVLYLATFCCISILGITVFIIQSLNNEKGIAASSPMVISDIEVSQDTLPIYRGTNKQLMLKIKIVTKGNTNRLNFNAITLAARGSSKDAFSIIKNARLWYSSNDNHFNPSKQIGLTHETIENSNFTISGIKQLNEGANYFWLTYDINNSSNYKNLVVDAECISVRIGTLEYDPSIAAPPGARKILQNKPYYSTSNKDISSLSCWNTKRDGSGESPESFNELSATFTIQPGHILRNQLSACIPILLIENGGVLTSSSNIKANLLEIFPGGTYIQETSLKDLTNLKRINIHNSGNYIHANAGKLPGIKRQIAEKSTIVITKCSNVTFIDSICWGNLVIDYKDTVDIDFGTAFSKIRGDLEIRNTGNISQLYSSKNDSISIDGDFILNGGNISFCGNNNNIVLNVINSFSVKNGKLSDILNKSHAKGHLKIYTGKTIAFIGGETNFENDLSVIICSESNLKWIQQSNAAVKLANIVILPGATLSLTSDTLQYLPANRKLLVEEGATIVFQTGIIIGGGTLKLMPRSTINTAHKEGIYSEGNLGSIQTDSRIISSEINIIYSGNETPQNTGVYVTSSNESVVNNFIVNKTNFTGIVILNQDFIVKGSLYQQRGSINKNTYSFYNEQLIGQTLNQNR